MRAARVSDHGHWYQTNALTDWNAPGITALSFTVNGLSVTLAHLIPPAFPNIFPAWALSLTSLAAGPLTGALFFNNTQWDMSFTLNGAASSGAFNTDFLGGGPNGECRTAKNCHFTGSFVMVPEPASLALFGLAITGLAALRRNTRRRA